MNAQAPRTLSIKDAGDDVRALQRALDALAKPYFHPAVASDGVFGKSTVYACKALGWALGLDEAVLGDTNVRSVSPEVQAIIIDPSLRARADLDRAAKRAPELHLRQIAVDGTPVFWGLAKPLVRARENGWRKGGILSSADRRPGEAEKYGRDSQVKLHWCYTHRVGGRCPEGCKTCKPANEPGFSSHELKSDGKKYAPVQRGKDLQWWQLGLDCEFSDELVAVLLKLGYSAWKPYTDPDPEKNKSERQHVNFTKDPGPVLDGVPALRGGMPSVSAPAAAPSAITVAPRPVRPPVAPVAAPAFAGTVRWSCVPANAVEFSEQAADGTVKIIARDGVAGAVTICAAVERDGRVALGTLRLDGRPSGWPGPSTWKPDASTPPAGGGDGQPPDPGPGTGPPGGPGTGGDLDWPVTAPDDEDDDDEPGDGAVAGLVVQIRRLSASEPLANGWVYRRDESRTVTVLRTDAQGRLLKGPDGSTLPGEYRTPFDADGATQLDLAFSRGSVPVPPALVASQPRAFALSDIPRPGQAPAVEIPEARVVVERPGDLSLWPLSFELPTPAYATSGLPQGQQAYDASGKLIVIDDDPRPPPVSATDRPGVRWLVVAGRVDETATTVRVRLLDAGGATVPLRAPAAPQSPAEDLQVQAGEANGGMRPFSVRLLPADPAAAFGFARLVVIAEGQARPALAAYGVLLCGAQTGLGADESATARGPVLGEADERVQIDFTSSPQLTETELGARARVRRMVTFKLGQRKRAYDPSAPGAAGATVVVKPEMPLWTAELQLVGLSAERLADLMARRCALLVADARTSLQVTVAWQLTLAWNGPDVNAKALGVGPRPQLRLVCDDPPFKATQTFEAHFGPRGELLDESGEPHSLEDGRLAGALSPTAAPTFPVADRREAGAVLRGQTRPWGRQAGAAQLPATIIEWQPAIFDRNGVEIIRGGDGALEIVALEIDGTPIDGGGSKAPVLRLPPFRVRGTNPAPGDLAVLVRAIVETEYAARATEARVKMLSLGCWVETAVRIFTKETGSKHFRDGKTQRTRHRVVHVEPPPKPNWVEERYYGDENGMPSFGQPNGYGITQLDNMTLRILGPIGTPAGKADDRDVTLRGVTADEAWSFVENLRTSMRLIFDDKANLAYKIVSSAPSFAPDSHRARAIFQREVVRAYNGGTEFGDRRPAKERKDDPRNAGQLGTWSLYPSVANDRLEYPNKVLGTTVAYFSHASRRTAIPFSSNDYGPLTQEPG